MKDIVEIKDLNKYIGKEVKVGAWVTHHRSSGKIQFLNLRDGTGFLQAIVSKNEVPEKIWKTIEEITQESSLFVYGKVVEDKRSPGEVELHLKDLEIIQLSPEFPIQPKEHGTEFLMDNRHLWFRSKRQVAILKIRNEIIQAIRDFYYERDFVLIDSPILTPTSCEGTSTLFEVKYFDEFAYLTQSGQLYLEPACIALRKVYCFGPTFRAEKSKTRRHLTEFWMVEPEVAFADLDDIIKLAEEFVEYIVQRVLERKKEELKIIERDTKMLENVKKPFNKITYDEAAKFLLEKENQEKMKENNAPLFIYGNDFGGFDETLLTENLEKPLCITHYPANIKAFYMQPDEKDPTKAKCVDILAPEGYGEIIGGSQRIHNYDLLMKKIEENNLPVEPLQWYLDIRKYGSVPHSGFGLGIERTVAWICNLPHVRETIPYPRMLNRLKP